MPVFSFSFLLVFICITSCVANADKAAANSVLRLGIYHGFVKSFPATNGIMWSDRVIVDIFKQQGFEIDIKEYPARRLGPTLNRDIIDSFLDTQDPSSVYQKKSIRSELPVSVVSWYIYFDHRNGWQPRWPPDAILRSKIGKSKRGAQSLQSKWGLNISQSSSFEANVKMVNLGRADYWIDDASGLRTVSRDLLKSENQGFIYQLLYSRPLYYYFQNTTRGKQLADIFHQGMVKLLADGEFGRTFRRLDVEPDITGVVPETLTFIRLHYPELNVAQQKGANQ